MRLKGEGEVGEKGGEGDGEGVEKCVVLEKVMGGTGEVMYDRGSTIM
jgi:hypothetical protein